MNLTRTFNGNFDEINTEQVIISQKDIYRKINNLDNSYDIFYLTTKDNHFVWEKISSHVIPYGSLVEDINVLSVLHNNNNLITQEGLPRCCLWTFYIVPEWF